MLKQFLLSNSPFANCWLLCVVLAICYLLDKLQTGTYWSDMSHDL